MKKELPQESETRHSALGAVSGSRHKWSVLDVCEKCGLERSLKPLWFADMNSRAGKTWVYLVDGEWTNQNPGCH